MRPPPPNENATRAGVASDVSSQSSERSNNSAYTTAPQWPHVVVIYSTSTKLWPRCANLEDAQRTVARLRRHGFDAKVENTRAANGKAFAVFMFQSGLRTLEQTQAAFNAHPEWREA